MFKKISIILFLAAIVGARHAVPLPGLPLFSDTAFADSYTQDGKPCPPECVSDSMEIVTWYPSPYNEYEELRLYPKYSADESSCDSFDKLGLMYYNKDEQALKVCWQSPDTLAYSWKDIALGQAGYWELSGNDISNTNSGKVTINGNLEVTDVYVSKMGVYLSEMNSSLLVYGKHFEWQCKSIGGTVFDEGNGNKMCRISGSSCPSGWTRYQSWGTTQQTACGPTCNCKNGYCQTSSHGWSNNGTTETCWYDTYGCEPSCGGYSQCYAKLAEVGCY